MALPSSFLLDGNGYDPTLEDKRYEVIEVKYLDIAFKPVKKTFTGYTAQIIQHEVDHCDGILI